ncbi:hypothetical protein MMC21_007702 [Puttea exsequens]|nr:hypothetical protein [Puttea exsequens]
MTLNDYTNEFRTAQNLVNGTGFTSARIYTLIQAGTTNTPTEAIQAAIDTETTLLLGLWGSGGQTGLNNEIAALQSALSAHGNDFADLIAGISVGSEDLYRISPTGIENLSGIGAGPDVISSYIGQVKSAIQNTAAAGKLVGHVDTWTAWVNGSNDAVIAASDFIGMDAYPYFQNTMSNGIENSYDLFFAAYQATLDAVNGKPVWVTETGWPVTGATENLAVPSTRNAQTYWDEVGCGRLFDKINTWWYTLYDAAANPSFGIVDSETSTVAIYDISCSGVASSASSVPEASVSAAVSEALGGSAQAGAQPTNVKIGSGSEAQGESFSAIETTGPIGAVKTPAAPQQGGSKGSPVGAPAPVVTNAPAEHPAPGNEAHAALSTLMTKTTVLSAASAASASACPASLSGTYEFPHLIVPVDKTQPTKAGGTSFNGTVSSTISSIFNFDIPASDSGKSCTLVFFLPKQDQLTTSAFSLSGSGGFDVALLSSPATEQTSYSTVPSASRNLGGPSSVAPGNEYVIASGACSAGERIGYEVSATGDLDLNYFQDFNPSPIGFYVTVC